MRCARLGLAVQPEGGWCRGVGRTWPHLQPWVGLHTALDGLELSRDILGCPAGKDGDPYPEPLLGEPAARIQLCAAWVPHWVQMCAAVTSG